MLLTLQIVAGLSIGLFAGAALYVTLVEHPARMECGLEVATTEFPRSYRRGASLQAPLAAIGCAGAILLWANGATWLWLVAGITLGSAIPLTLLVIAPTNRRLLDPTLDRHSESAHQLLVRWGWLHAIRTALGVFSFIAVLVILSS